MKRLLIVTYVLFFLGKAAAKLDVSVNAEAAILINAETGKILYGKNHHNLHHPASTTKIATAIYALKHCEHQLDTIIAAPQDCIGSVTVEAMKKSNYTLPSHWLEAGGASHIGIKRGEELSLRDLLYGLMLASGNDAANVIGHFVSGSVPKFTEHLNEYLQEIGCNNTTFYNPHGQYHPNHLSTAYDMAHLTREALKHPTFREIVSAVRYERPKTNKQEPTMLLQKNRLLRKGEHYNPKAIGVKTGYFSDAAHTFVGAAEHEGRTLIAVLLKSHGKGSIFSDANKLFDAAFNEPKMEKVYVRQGKQKHVLELRDALKPVETKTVDSLKHSFFPSEEPSLRCLLLWDEECAVPIKKDQRVGELRLCTKEGEVLQKADLLAVEDVNPTLVYRLRHANYKPYAIFAVLIVMMSLVFRRLR